MKRKRGGMFSGLRIGERYAVDGFVLRLVEVARGYNVRHFIFRASSGWLVSFTDRDFCDVRVAAVGAERVYKMSGHFNFIEKLTGGAK